MAADTIAAVATPPGRGGIGIVRVSGPRARPIAEAVAGVTPAPRRARLARFHDAAGAPIDQGLVLFFPAPHSYTGEDVLELHGHGGPVVMDLLLAATLAHGARLARPGEFTERAFLNDRIDLAQAEAVADLIASASTQAAHSAARSLQGAFSQRINALADAVLELRVYVEAAIDFPDEEVDFLSEGDVLTRTRALRAQVTETLAAAEQGVALTEGIHLVLAGRPNVGKSSLLNRFAGYDRAIVTEIAGTTRDTLSEQLTLDGMPVRITDTAGLHASPDRVEQEGIRRARTEALGAERVLLVTESSRPDDWRSLIAEQRLPADRVSVVRNKIDLSGEPPGPVEREGFTVVQLSALTGAGLEALIAHLKQLAGYRGGEGVFSARRRHVTALTEAEACLERGIAQIEARAAGELLAEDLRAAHDALGEIVGRVTPDALLGEIFASFCIGK